MRPQPLPSPSQTIPLDAELEARETERKSLSLDNNTMNYFKILSGQYLILHKTQKPKKEKSFDKKINNFCIRKRNAINKVKRKIIW